MNTDRFAVTSNLGPYAIVQRSALQLLGPTEFRVYCALSTYCAGDARDVWPSRQTLAELCSCSVDTVDRALRTLVKDGWVSKEQRRTEEHQATNVYTVHYIIGVPQLDQGRMGAAQHKGAETPEQGRTRPRKQGRTGAARVLPVGGLPPTPPAAPAARQRDEVWDALAAVFGDPVTDGERRLRGKIASSLKRAGATGLDVSRRIRAWDEHWRPDGKGVSPTLTLTALEKHWTALGKTAGIGTAGATLLTDDERDALRSESERKQREQIEMVNRELGRSA